MANQDIALSRIRTDGGTQIRVDLDPATIEDYAADMLGGDHFPPIVVFFDGSDYWLADGFHRLEAASKAKLDRIKADVRKGTCRDAVLFAVGANAGHGLRRTNADKRRAAMALLQDQEWSAWSDHEIARRCGVSQTLVSNIRRGLSENGFQIPKERTASRGGTKYTVNTSKIGASPNGGEPPGSPDPAEAGESPDAPAPTPSPTVAGSNGKEYPTRKPSEPRAEPAHPETEEPEPEEEEETPGETDAEEQEARKDAQDLAREIHEAKYGLEAFIDKGLYRIGRYIYSIQEKDGIRKVVEQIGPEKRRSWVNDLRIIKRDVQVFIDQLGGSHR